MAKQKKQPTLQELISLHQRKSNYIDSKLKTVDKDVRRLQENLLNILISDYVGKFDIVNGKPVLNAKNMRLYSELDNILNRFEETYNKNFLVKVANDMLKITDFTKDYYRSMGYGDKILSGIEKGMSDLSLRIGISTKGNLIKGSYLDTLAQAPEVRLKIKDYVLSSISEGKSYNEFLKGFKELVVGGKGITGSYEKYYKTYIYDTYNKVDRTIEKHYAEELNLQYFIYMGGLIETSRQFCRERAGKVFSSEEAKEWKNDPDLPVKNKNEYNPIIDMGGPNCRHEAMWISDELACKKRPDVCKEEQL